jgi:hypothetical protein
MSASKKYLLAISKIAILKFRWWLNYTNFYTKLFCGSQVIVIFILNV